jgi:hypothetical protein
MKADNSPDILGKKIERTLWWTSVLARWFPRAKDLTDPFQDLTEILGSEFVIVGGIAMNVYVRTRAQ